MQNFSSLVRSQQGTALHMGGVLQYKLEVYCSTFQTSCAGLGLLNSAHKGLSGPVLRDTVGLSQRYPPIAPYGVFGVSTWQLGAIPSPSFLTVSPLESMRSGGAIPPSQRGYLSDTCAIPHENNANG